MNSNIEQHLNDKNKLKPEIITKINSVLNLDRDSLESFVGILELPNEVFDAIYPTYKIEMSKLFDDPDNQKQIITHLKTNPVDDINILRAELNTFINEITDDEALSENKKDLISTIFHNSVNVIEQIIEGGGREFIPVKIIKLNSDAIIPQYAHPTDAGADICAIEETKLEPGETKIVKTGLAVAIPIGYEIQVRPRSGLSLKSGLRIANAPGTIDTDYRGEIGIIMTNTNDIPYVIDKGMKIAQLLIAPTPRIKWDEVFTIEELGSTERGEGGFGSTGSKKS